MQRADLKFTEEDRDKDFITWKMRKENEKQLSDKAMNMEGEIIKPDILGQII